MRESEPKAIKISLYIKIVFAFLILVLVCLLALSLLRAHRMHAIIIKKMRSCPSWIEIDDTDFVSKQAIMDTMADVAQYDLDTLREAIAECASKYSDDMDLMAFVYVFNRYLFDIQPQATENRYFGGWNAPDELWPLERTEDGQIILTGRFRGYFGEPYLALEEFDYFSQKYGRRASRTPSIGGIGIEKHGATGSRQRPPRQ